MDYLKQIEEKYKNAISSYLKTDFVFTDAWCRDYKIKPLPKDTMLDLDGRTTG